MTKDLKASLEHVVYMSDVLDQWDLQDVLDWYKNDMNKDGFQSTIKEYVE